MEKVEQYIKEHTNRYSNHVELAPYITGFTEWLTIDDARRVAEIAREETIKEVCEWLNSHYRDYMHNPTGKQLEAFFGMDMIEDLNNYLDNKKKKL
jgi:hypothetical protein